MAVGSSRYHSNTANLQSINYLKSLINSYLSIKSSSPHQTYLYMYIHIHTTGIQAHAQCPMLQIVDDSGEPPHPGAIDVD